MSPPPLWRDWRVLLACGMGCGAAAKAPGTLATAAAWLLYLALALYLPPPVLLGLAALMLLVGAPLCSYAERTLQRKDDGRIVWDEIAAFFAILPLLPPGWGWQVAAFALFRLLDITKPFPINQLEKRLRGGAGIMADDVAAAALTLLALHLLAAAFAGVAAA